jgi:hypothetical protein
MAVQPKLWPFNLSRDEPKLSRGTIFSTCVRKQGVSHYPGMEIENGGFEVQTLLNSAADAIENGGRRVVVRMQV